MANLITSTEQDRAESPGILPGTPGPQQPEVTKSTPPVLRSPVSGQPPQPAAGEPPSDPVAQGPLRSPTLLAQLPGTPVAGLPPQLTPGDLANIKAGGAQSDKVTQQVIDADQAKRDALYKAGQDAIDTTVAIPDQTSSPIEPYRDYEPISKAYEQNAVDELAVQRARKAAQMGDPLQSVFSGNKLPATKFGSGSAYEPPSFFNDPIGWLGKKKDALIKGGTDGLAEVAAQLQPVKAVNPFKNEWGTYGKGSLAGALYLLDVGSGGTVIRGGIANYYNAFQDIGKGKLRDPLKIAKTLANPEVRYKNMQQATSGQKNITFLEDRSKTGLGLLTKDAGWWNTLPVVAAIALEGFSSPVDLLSKPLRTAYKGFKSSATAIKGTSKVVPSIAEKVAETSIAAKLSAPVMPRPTPPPGVIKRTADAVVSQPPGTVSGWRLDPNEGSWVKQADPGVPLQMGTQRPGQPPIINPEVPPAGAAMEDLAPKPVGQPLPDLNTALPNELPAKPPGQVELGQPPEGVVQPPRAGANPTSMDYQFNNALQMGEGEGHSLFLGGVGGRVPKEGFLVATGQADAIPLDYTPEDLSSVLNKKMTEALDDPAIISVGAQKVGNEYKFETSYLFDSEADALKYAAETGQQTIYNYATKVSTPVPLRSPVDVPSAFARAAANLPEDKLAQARSVSPADSIAAVAEDGGVGTPEVLVMRTPAQLTELARDLGHYSGTEALTKAQLQVLNQQYPGIYGTYGHSVNVLTAPVTTTALSQVSVNNVTMGMGLGNWVAGIKPVSFAQWVEQRVAIQRAAAAGSDVSNLVEKFVNTPVPPIDIKYLREALFTTSQRGASDEQLLSYYRAAQDLADNAPAARMLSFEANKLEKQLIATDQMISLTGADPLKYIDAPRDYDSLVRAFQQAAADRVSNPQTPQPGSRAAQEMYLLTKGALERHILDNMKGHLDALEGVMENAIDAVVKTYDDIRTNAIPEPTKQTRLANVYTGADDIVRESAQGTSDILRAANTINASDIAATTLAAEQAVQSRLAMAALNLQPNKVEGTWWLKHFAWKFKSIVGTELSQPGQIYEALRSASSSKAQAIKEALLVPAVMTDLKNSAGDLKKLLKPFIGSDRSALNKLMMAAYDSANANKYLQTLGEQSFSRFGEVVMAKSTLAIAESRYFKPFKELAASYGLDDYTTNLLQAYGAKLVNTWDDAENYLTAVSLGNETVATPWFLQQRAIDKLVDAKLTPDTPRTLDDLLPLAVREVEWGEVSHEMAASVFKLTPDELTNIMFSAPTVLAKKVEELDQQTFDILMDTGTLGKMPTSTTHLAEQVIKRLNLEGEFKDIGEFILTNPEEGLRTWVSQVASAASKDMYNLQLKGAALLDGWAFKSMQEAPEGFKQAKSVHDLWFHPDVAEVIDIIHAMDSPQAMNILAQTMNTIKGALLGTPGFVVRNSVSNVIQFHRAGGDAFSLPKQLQKHFAELRGRGLEAYDDTVKAYAGGTMTEREAIRAYMRSGNSDDISAFYGELLTERNPSTYKGFSLEAIQNHTKYLYNDLFRGGGVRSFGRDIGNISRNLMDGVVWTAMIGSEVIEGGMKKALFLSILRDDRTAGDIGRAMLGGTRLPEYTSVSDATNYISKYFFNYREKGTVDKGLSTYVFPFWQFFSRNITSAIQHTLSRPGQVVGTWRLYNYVNSLSGATDDPEVNDSTVPQYIQNRMPLFIKTGTDDRGKPQYITLPFSAYDGQTDGINTILSAMQFVGNSTVGALRGEFSGTPTEKRAWMLNRQGVPTPIPNTPLEVLVDMIHPVWKSAVQVAQVAKGEGWDFLTNKPLLEGNRAEGRANSFLGVNMPPWVSLLLTQSVPILAQLNLVNPGDVFGTSQKEDSSGKIVRNPTKAFGGIGAYRSDRDAKDSISRLLAWSGANTTPLDTAWNAGKTVDELRRAHKSVGSAIKKLQKDTAMTNLPQRQKDKVIEELVTFRWALGDGLNRLTSWARQQGLTTRQARELMIRNQIRINDLPEASYEQPED